MLEETLIIAIQAHVASAMIDNQQIAKTAQPVCIHHLPIGHDMHGMPIFSLDEETLPSNATIFSWATEPALKFPTNR